MIIFALLSPETEQQVHEDPFNMFFTFIYLKFNIMERFSFQTKSRQTNEGSWLLPVITLT
jgi:hypothetical protein